MALYNRYRPRNLSEVIGQDHVTSQLAASFDNGKLNHAYILSGPKGCGKTSTARILAKNFNCEKYGKPTSTPCEECPQCRSINAGTSADVYEMDAASQGGVDSARELRQRTSLMPASARFRIFIIDEAHMVTGAAFNALLKVIEEPPAHVKFIFATTEVDKIIGTIRSRAWQYPFRLVSGADMIKHLQNIAIKENYSIDEDVFALIARAGGGSVRDTVGLLDQLTSGTTSARLEAAEASSLLGLTDGVLLDETIEGVIKRDARILLSVVNKVVSLGQDPKIFANEALGRMRDLLVIKTVPDAYKLGLLGALTTGELENLNVQAQRANIGSIIRASNIFDEASSAMKSSTNPQRTLELAVADLASGEDERLARMEAAIASIGELLKNTPVAAPSTSTPVASAVTSSPEVAPEPPEAIDDDDRQERLKNLRDRITVAKKDAGGGAGQWERILLRILNLDDKALELLLDGYNFSGIERGDVLLKHNAKGASVEPQSEVVAKWVKAICDVNQNNEWGVKLV